MGKRIDDAESDAVLLRTSADIASNALVQLECMAQKWPEFTKDVTEYRRSVERLVEKATEHGYIAKTRI